MTDQVMAYPKFQASIMDGPLQVVVRAETIGEFTENLEGACAAVPLIDAFGEKMIPPKPQGGVDLIKQELGGQVIEEYRNCAHGQMQWKEGVSKSTNKPYKGWFCPVRNGCSPIFER